jgi:hypothetical protein
MNDIFQITQSIDEDKKSEGFIARLTETIINNLQIRINNVHVRYEGIY